MKDQGFSTLPTISRCAHCGQPIRYGAEHRRMPHDRWAYHRECVCLARQQAIVHSRRALAEDDLLPSEAEAIRQALVEWEAAEQQWIHLNHAERFPHRADIEAQIAFEQQYGTQPE